MSEPTKEFRAHVKKLHSNGYTVSEIAKETKTLPRVIDEIVGQSFTFTKEQMEIALRVLSNQGVDQDV